MKISTFDLRLFAAIADFGSLSAAARQMGREKSSVSRDLAALEDRLGTRLLNRSTRRISLTEAGQVLLDHARRVVAETLAAEAAIDALGEEPRGVLRVTAPYAILRFVLAPGLPAFAARHPHLRLELDASTNVVNLIEEGFDVAIRTGPMPPSSLIVRRLCDAMLVLAAAPAYRDRAGLPEGPGDLCRHATLDLNRALVPTPWTLHRAEGGSTPVQVDPLLATADPGVLLDLALQGMGIATLPDVYAAPLFATGALVPVLPGYHRGIRPVQAVFPTRHQISPKVRAFLDFAAGRMKVASGPGACLGQGLADM